MTAQLSAIPRGDHIEVALQDASGNSATVHMNPSEALAAILSIVQATNSLPSDRTAPLHNQHAVLKSKDPSFQVGVKPSGGVVLALRPDPFPLMEFEFDAQALAKLIADLRKAATVPTNLTGTPH